MNEKFTPGEWEVNEKTMECGNLYRYCFEVISPDVRKRVCYSETDEQKNAEQMQANAALIAAAPQLYKMLKLACYEIEIMANYCEENNMERDAQSYTNLVFYIHKVLKKARGEE